MIPGYHQHSFDFGQNTFSVLEHFIVPKPDDGISGGLQFRSPFSVRLLHFSMLSTIEFNDKICIFT